MLLNLRAMINTDVTDSDMEMSKTLSLHFALQADRPLQTIIDETLTNHSETTPSH